MRRNLKPQLDQFDVVLGGSYPETSEGEKTVWYLDDVCLVKAANN